MATSRPQRSGALRMQELTETPVAADIEIQSTTPVPVLPKNSASLPFLARPLLLDGSMAGDVGFDPLGFSNEAGRLKFMREAEIRHARLAMLAAAGWPAAELLDAPLAKLVGLTPFVEESSGMSPSILNGGLGQVSPIFWALVLGGATFLEVAEFEPLNKDRKIVGDLGFDPAGLYKGMDEEGKKAMELKEIKNGRLAMIAIAGFVAQEALTNTPIF